MSQPGVIQPLLRFPVGQRESDDGTRLEAAGLEPGADASGGIRAGPALPAVNVMEGRLGRAVRLVHAIDSGDLDQRDGIGHAVEAELAERAGADRQPGQGLGARGDEDPAGRAYSLDAGGQVHGAADHGVVVEFVRPEIADGDKTRMKSWWAARRAQAVRPANHPAVASMPVTMRGVRNVVPKQRPRSTLPSTVAHKEGSRR